MRDQIVNQHVLCIYLMSDTAVSTLHGLQHSHFPDVAAENVPLASRSTKAETTIESQDYYRFTLSLTLG